MGITVALFVTLTFFHSHFVLHSAQESERNPECPLFSCGSLEEVGFPFSNTTNLECGLCVLNCTETESFVQFHVQGKWYPVKDIDYFGRTIVIFDADVQTELDSNSCDLLKSFSEQASSPFLSINVTQTHPFFKCKFGASSLFFNQDFKSYIACPDYDLYYYDDPDKVLPPLPETLHDDCSVVQLPSANLEASPGLIVHNFTSMWSADFKITWQISPECLECQRQGGLCLSSSSGRLKCSNFKQEANAEGPNVEAAKVEGANTAGSKVGMKLIVALSVAAGVLVTLFIILCFLGMKAENSMLHWKKRTPIEMNIEAYLEKHGPLRPKRYSHKEIKIMTDSFTNKLGHGGFGSVFKGTLNKKSVAVKVLSEIEGNGEDFINEFASISRTSHINIVSLLGYCFEVKRALIYEFMPNGSLEKFIYDKGQSEAYSCLEWETLYQVAVGIAKGLKYLHEECNIPILHFDIKPHNILLDQNYCPKISDFGMAKLCPTNKSSISIQGARGTTGYIAPEVANGNNKDVSHKSDVYSYGMMILEMTGRRKIIDTGVTNTSDLYLPNWIYRRILTDGDLDIQGIVSEADRAITRKMSLVGLWCIQKSPSDRPTMRRVLEMLEGGVELLCIPPTPYLCSPPTPRKSSVNLV